MTYDILLAGVGGQGVLSIAAIIASAAMTDGLFVRQSEVHGMSQRGGGVSAHLRLSDKEINSDLITFYFVPTKHRTRVRNLLSIGLCSCCQSQAFSNILFVFPFINFSIILINKRLFEYFQIGSYRIS